MPLKNIVGNGENAGYQCFLQFQRQILSFKLHLILSSAVVFNLKKSDLHLIELRRNKKSVSNYSLSIPLQSATKIWDLTMLFRKIN